jgi:hypothetical protein
VSVRIFPKHPKERNSLPLEQSGEADTHPELPTKGEGEAEGWGKKEFPGMRDY